MLSLKYFSRSSVLCFIGPGAARAGRLVTLCYRDGNSGLTTQRHGDSEAATSRLEVSCVDWCVGFIYTIDECTLLNLQLLMLCREQPAAMRYKNALL